MQVTDEQLHAWSHRGDPLQAWHTFTSIQWTLTKGLRDYDCDIYPQGSYGNGTNLEHDSDVDVVVALRSAFYSDTSELDENELAAYENCYTRDDVTWADFREVVGDILQKHYFSTSEGPKCTDVGRGLFRLTADVLVSVNFRYYQGFVSCQKQEFKEGVRFYHNATEIENYPKRHMAASRRKDRESGGRFKKVVRIAKNARNAAVKDDASRMEKTTAPSYYVESLLWNVPTDVYKKDHVTSYKCALTWLDGQRDHFGSFWYPHGMGKLFGAVKDKPWRQEDAALLLDELMAQLPRD
ncbi:nucleotidyltransferase [Nonomuraea monospora]|uniref:Nucleotidyltransferase n=1 Tax=Nonomuraea monospora TaxID=568818 RepID=A0ABN3CT57_9ACTN